MTRGAVALTLVFLGLATAFAGFSLAATGRGADSAGAALLGLALVAVGVCALPAPVPAADAADTNGPRASARDA